jgi:hypothetical protein
VTGTGAAGLLVDAEVSRGSFTLSVDLAVPPGQVVGVLGPNGAGKSTLLKAVAGLTPVARGRIVLRGRVVDDAGTGEFAEAAARPVGFVFQDYRLFPHLTVAENVAFAPRARGAGRAAARLAAAGLLARLGLTGLAGRRPGSLSGGQAQRVAWPGRWPGAPTCCCSTSRCPRWTPAPGWTSGPSCAATWPSSPGRACWSPTTRWRHWCWPTGWSSSRTAGSSRTAARRRCPGSPPPSTWPAWSA